MHSGIHNAHVLCAQIISLLFIDQVLDFDFWGVQVLFLVFTFAKGTKLPLRWTGTLGHLFIRTFRLIFNLKIFEKDVINISRFGKITKEYCDLKNELLENFETFI